MTRWEQAFPFGYRLFMKIAEPRVVRLIYFGIYAAMGFAGVGVLFSPPSSFQNVIGTVLVYAFGGFMTLGAIFGAFSVLPGIWWLERVGIISLWTSLGMYVVIIVFLKSSPVGLSVCVALILMFILRWREIRRYQLAPIGR